MLATLGCIASQGSGGGVIDRTTPVTVVNAAYDTSGNGGRKLVRLDNGWLICIVKTGANDFYWYKSTDNGSTWVQLCYSTESCDSWAIASIGTNVYTLGQWNGRTYNVFYKFDATTRTNVNISATYTSIDTTQTSFGSGCSLVIDTNGHLHATWTSKNATYPNSFNIRYSKSTDGGATWATPKQITTLNTSGSDYLTPCIVIDSVGKPQIIHIEKASSFYIVRTIYFTGTNWVAQSIYTVSTYAQDNPTATVDSNGVIHVAWYGLDATDTTVSNIRYSKSTDNGVTWSAMVKLTTGNTATQIVPSITCDLNNDVHVAWMGVTTAGAYNLRIIKSTSGVFGIISDITAYSSGTNGYPSVCDNFKNFEKPLLIFKSNVDVKVKFYGKWTETA